MIPLVALGTTLVIGGLVFANLLAGNRAPSEKRLEEEFAKLKADLDQWAGDLVPINKEELELFSLGQDKQVLKKGVSTTAKGILTTIYHEPVFAYTYRGFIGKTKQPNALLLARTAANEYRYWIQKGVATLFIDGQNVGEISVDGELRGRRTGKVIASLDKNHQEWYPVTVGSREVGSLTAAFAKGEKGLHERAFQFLKDDMNDKEEQLFLALILVNLIDRTVRS